MALIALGVGGGIGAYKAVEVARALQKRGHDVAAIMTRNARRFVTPLTFEAITRRKVITSQWTPGMNADIEHIALATEAKLLLIAPATANVIARFAAGIADDFLTSFHLATRAPILMAPAMNTHMLEHPATQANLATLAARGVRFVEPGAGYLACGWIGRGRLAEPDEIAAAADQCLRGSTSLAGRHVVVSAGPTYEDLDPVRYLGNRSTGRMGLAIADEALARGARVTLVVGPTTLAMPAGADVRHVRSAADMHTAVFGAAPSADVVIMAAAVADYTPAAGAAPQKVKKTDGDLSIALSRTRDILADLGAWRADRVSPVLVGFAAETERVVEQARAKLASKRVDLVVANDVSRADAGFAVDTNAATLVTRDEAEAVPLQQKRTLASVILDRIETLLATAAPAKD